MEIYKQELPADCLKTVLDSIVASKVQYAQAVWSGYVRMEQESRKSYVQ